MVIIVVLVQKRESLTSFMNANKVAACCRGKDSRGRISYRTKSLPPAAFGIKTTWAFLYTVTPPWSSCSCSELRALLKVMLETSNDKLWSKTAESSSGEEKENALPSRKPAKKLKLSNKDPSGEHWHFITDDEEDLGKKLVPKNTAASTKWALANFNAWRQSGNKRFSGNSEKQVPGNFLEGTNDPAALCKWLTLYIAETWKTGASTLWKCFTACWLAYFDIDVLKTRTVPTLSITMTTDLMHYIMLLTMYFVSSVRLVLAQKPSQL